VGSMIINLKGFLLSDDLVYNVSDRLTLKDEKFLEENRLKNEVEFDGKFFKVDKSLLLDAKIDYFYSESCARCLKEFENKITAKFNAIIVDALDEDYEAEDIQILIKDSYVDLEESIKQLVYLSMPMKALCKSSCKGICSKCGINLNTDKCECNDFVIDPRLEKLKTLLK
jgi:uncharacterized protein